MIKITIAEYLRIVSVPLTATAISLHRLLVAAGLTDIASPRAIGNVSGQGVSVLGINIVSNGSRNTVVTGSDGVANGSVTILNGLERAYWSTRIIDEIKLNSVGGTDTITIEIYFG